MTWSQLQHSGYRAIGLSGYRAIGLSGYRDRLSGNSAWINPDPEGCRVAVAVQPAVAISLLVTGPVACAAARAATQRMVDRLPPQS